MLSDGSENNEFPFWLCESVNYFLDPSRRRSPETVGSLVSCITFSYPSLANQASQLLATRGKKAGVGTEPHKTANFDRRHRAALYFLPISLRQW